MDNKLTQPPVKSFGPGDDLEMIKSPKLWPCWPVLFLKNRSKRCPLLKGNFPMTGIIIDGHPTVVLVGTMGITKWEKTERVSYASVEELLADNWIVD